MLLFGVLGALVFRGIFIGIGAVALGAAHWVIFVFGAFLIFTSYRLARAAPRRSTRAGTGSCSWCGAIVPSTEHYQGNRVFVRERGRWLATPVFAVLLVVASTDVLFAIDSIPAIFAVTNEAFIVLAANCFALMGLRAAYFVVVGALGRFEYLHYGLAVVLGVVGLKMLTSDVYEPPIWLTLGSVVVILGLSVLASLWATRKRALGAERPVDRLTELPQAQRLEPVVPQRPRL